MSARSQWAAPRLPWARHAELQAGCAALLCTITFLRHSDPATSGLFPPCPFLWLTGFYCPGCGSLRAMHQLLHGHLARAFSLNPFALVAIPFLAYGAVSRAAFLLRDRYLPRIFLPPWIIWTLGAAVLLFGILRNIPVYPFRVLTPGGM
jgi:hypothetical protein